ncbi:hypothetical protein N7G274_005468 [Stereocaulon virgatum]|uniref:NAA35-like N-terminal domain-containing protein n=1 Tax=Stereocaulon virgatum TaxID=373712 RepID=A0ABR4A702_9LECA
MADMSTLSIAAEHDEPASDSEQQNSVTVFRSRNYPMAQDITADFAAAASALNTGQLVKDEYFTLFEAVGALEIMDPKMDSGFLLPGETLEDNYDILRELLPEEVLGIVDQMLCYEVS